MVPVWLRRTSWQRVRWKWPGSREGKKGPEGAQDTLRGNLPLVTYFLQRGHTSKCSQILPKQPQQLGAKLPTPEPLWETLSAYANCCAVLF